MPQYRDDDYDDYDDRRGVHRRRFERKKSSTPIIVGVCIVCAAILGIFVFRSLLSGDDPEVKKAKARAAVSRFLQAALSKDENRIFDNINAEGGNGWVNKNLGSELAKRYRFWDQADDREEAKRWRLEQDKRMIAEIVKIPERLALDSIAAIEAALESSKVRSKMASTQVTITHQGGRASIWLLEGEGGSFIVQNWQLDQPARGRNR